MLCWQTGVIWCCRLWVASLVGGSPCDRTGTGRTQTLIKGGSTCSFSSLDRSDTSTWHRKYGFPASFRHLSPVPQSQRFSRSLVGGAAPLAPVGDHHSSQSSHHSISSESPHRPHRQCKTRGASSHGALVAGESDWRSGCHHGTPADQNNPRSLGAGRPLSVNRSPDACVGSARKSHGGIRFLTCTGGEESHAANF